jgi:methyl-accepting chemotaxis protein WspA
MLRLRQLTIKQKLYALIAFGTVGLGVVLALGGWLLLRYRIGGPEYERINQSRRLESVMEPAVLIIDRPYLLLLDLAGAPDQQVADRLTAALQQMEEEYRQEQRHWREELPDGPVKQAVTVDAFRPADEVFRLYHEELLPLVRDKKRQEARELVEKKIRPHFREHRGRMLDALKLVKQQTAKVESDARNNTSFWLTALLVLSALAMVSLAALGLLTARSIVRTTRRMIRRVHEMASGASDLTVQLPVDSQDEMGQLAVGINAMIAKIRAVVRRVRESSVQLLSTAAEIAATARQQDATVQGLSSSTAQVAAAVQEISSTSAELAATMNEVNGRANHAASLATAGHALLLGMEAAMPQLVESTASISAKLGIIREKADGINLLVTTITKVADQTNLLSINAAIEAEKAGEYGRGFLVVAREIRRLADQTAVATLDIENMVRHMQDAVSVGVMQMDKFSGEVRAGVAHIGEVNGQTSQIIDEVQGLRPRFQQVNEGMRQQSIGAQQISEAMTQMAGSSRQVAGSLDELKQATAHLHQAVEVLNQEVGQFTI